MTGCVPTDTAFPAFCEWEELQILFSAHCRYSLPEGNPKAQPSMEVFSGPENALTISGA